MNDIHRSVRIDKLIGKQVRIVWFDSDVTEGVLTGYDHGWYKFLEFNGKSMRFRKSHIKKISRV